jgi:hypothetical protein
MRQTLKSAWIQTTASGYPEHVFNASFDWLKKLSEPYLASIGEVNLTALGYTLKEDESPIRHYLTKELFILQELVSRDELWLPADFCNFLSDPQLYTRVRSCTGCYFNIAIRPAKTIGKYQGKILTFFVPSLPT